MWDTNREPAIIQIIGQVQRVEPLISQLKLSLQGIITKGYQRGIKLIRRSACIDINA